MADISKMNVKEASERGTLVCLKHPGTKEPLLSADGKSRTGLYVLGPDSDTYKNETKKSANKILRAQQQKLQGEKVRMEDLTMDSVDEQGIRLCTAVTTGWQGFEEGDKPLEFSKAAVEKMYRENDWMREQVSEFIQERANFLQK